VREEERISCEVLQAAHRAFSHAARTERMMAGTEKDRLEIYAKRVDLVRHLV
jgi:hypothetical protein